METKAAMFTWVTHGEAETEALGSVLGRLLQPGDLVALIGPLGAGKTCLARGIAAGMGIDEPVTSPTFILIAEYKTAAGFPLFHVDCYRLGDATAEALDIGLDEIIDDEGACVVEWAERIAGLLPDDHLRITMEDLGPGRRRLTYEPTGPRSGTVLHQLLDALPSGDTEKVAPSGQPC